jgi:hypothetical protein
MIAPLAALATRWEWNPAFAPLVFAAVFTVFVFFAQFVVHCREDRNS